MMDLFEHADANPPKKYVYTRRMEIEDQALAFHAKNPRVYELFCEFTIDRILVGFEHYGAAQIFGRIRWETDEPNKDGGSTFKINDAFCPHYARWFMRDYWQHAGFFRTRHLTSDDQPALGLPPLGPDDYRYNNQNGETV